MSRALTNDRIPYRAKLSNPKWQRRRLEILQRDGFACRKCGDDESELHVHHVWYSGEPWEAPDAALMTLCAPCHEEETEEKSSVEYGLVASLRRSITPLNSDMRALADLLSFGEDDRYPAGALNAVLWVLRDRRVLANIIEKRNRLIEESGIPE